MKFLNIITILLIHPLYSNSNEILTKITDIIVVSLFFKQNLKIFINKMDFYLLLCTKNSISQSVSKTNICYLQSKSCDSTLS